MGEWSDEDEDEEEDNEVTPEVRVMHTCTNFILSYLPRMAFQLGTWRYRLNQNYIISC